MPDNESTLKRLQEASDVQQKGTALDRRMAEAGLEPAPQPQPPVQEAVVEPTVQQPASFQGIQGQTAESQLIQRLYAEEAARVDAVRQEYDATLAQKQAQDAKPAHVKWKERIAGQLGFGDPVPTSEDLEAKLTVLSQQGQARSPEELMKAYQSQMQP